MTDRHTETGNHRHLLIFGATSVVGRYLLPLLDSPDTRISAVSRTSPGNWTARFPRVEWHIDNLPHAAPATATVTHILSLGPCDAFVAWLTQQVPQPALRQIIAFGSTSALTKRDSASPAERELAEGLRASESALARESLRLGAGHTLLRPTLIYGGEQDLIARIAGFAARWHCYPQLLGQVGAALRQPVHAADLAQAVVSAIDCEQAMDQTLDLVGGETLSLAQMIAATARARSRWTLPVPMPLAPLLGLATLLGTAAKSSALNSASIARMSQDQVFDSGPATRILGFRPRPFSP